MICDGFESRRLDFMENGLNGCSPFFYAIKWRFCVSKNVTS